MWVPSFYGHMAADHDTRFLSRSDIEILSFISLRKRHLKVHADLLLRV